MTETPIPFSQLLTDRLVLRPTRLSDVDRAVEIQSDWEVTRMLRMAAYPPDQEKMRRWFAAHEGEWLAGRAYRFAVEVRGQVLGLVDIDEISAGEGELGYWFEKSSWGQGYASEAARAMVNFGFFRIGLSMLRSGHAADNPASGNVLRKLGFRPYDAIRAAYVSRGHDIIQQRYMLASPLRA